MTRPALLIGALLGLAVPALPALADEPDSNVLYNHHCSVCHGVSRLGGIGPALLPDNLSRLKPDEAVEVIRDGRVASQMPAYGELLSEPEIAALAEWIYEPPEVEPTWTDADILASHEVRHPYGTLPDAPVFEVDDLQNLFIVVEIGDHHVSLLDGDTFERITRFPSRYALHGGPKYTPDGRYVYFGSRDGWVTKYDIYNLEVTAEVRAGINMRNIAVSADGRYVLAGNYLPHTLALFDARDLDLIATIPVEGLNGESSRVSAVYTAPPRDSFVAALRDIPEVWEIRWPEERAEGDETIVGDFALHRMEAPDYLDDFFFDMEYRYLVGAARGGKGGQVFDMDEEVKVADLPLEGMPHLGAGITWELDGRRVMAIPHIDKGLVSVFDMTDWSLITNIETDGPGFFMRSHENSPYAWVDVFFGPNHDRVHVIDKQSLEIVETLIPEPGKTAAHVEFDRRGETLLLSVWDDDGYLLWIDANTLEEIDRMPMKRPSGKYNVWNKTQYEEGTSH
ncbi:cytochrome C oxidase Cbb3 [Halomonas campisalis]|uniref:Cytochrome C oxidase Cbb3 n=1 Tax=Billgrantia campisalis TaxID=74661 RepID=A0ABS9P513_9GAMM|nr:nitrite reductase [Halomonas campisalis]MCG6656881.1 cytochrome C oxidase Cbb3 [Halomonas campisalis]MDR5862070.1 cytochrome D1 domain-containing protein [Halomonas campisalis]